jgi:putative glutamine amidotransferase
MNAPLIGITTYRKRIEDPEVDWMALPAPYVQAIALAGGLPILIPVGLENETLRSIFERIDGLLLTGGGDIHPRFYGELPDAELIDVDELRDQTEIDLVLWAAVTGKPFLGICRGIQVLNVALGGDLYQDITMHITDTLEHNLKDLPPNALAHRVSLNTDSKLQKQLGKTMIDTNSRHHQAIRKLAPGLLVAATTPDGIIEAVELPDHPFGMAVQWHPEHLFNNPESIALFSGLTNPLRE